MCSFSSLESLVSYSKKVLDNIGSSVIIFCWGGVKVIYVPFTFLKGWELVHQFFEWFAHFCEWVSGRANERKSEWGKERMSERANSQPCIFMTVHFHSNHQWKYIFLYFPRLLPLHFHSTHSAMYILFQLQIYLFIHNCDVIQMSHAQLWILKGTVSREKLFSWGLGVMD